MDRDDEARPAPYYLMCPRCPRGKLKKTLPERCWEETPEAHRARLKACAAQINSACDVDGLCRELPSRVQDLGRRQGDRLAK